MTASQPASLLALAERLADTQIPFLFLKGYDESFGRNGSKLAFDRADQCLSLGQLAMTIESTAEVVHAFLSIRAACGLVSRIARLSRKFANDVEAAFDKAYVSAQLDGLKSC